MKKFTQLMMVCGLMIGGLMFASMAQAQTESAAPAAKKSCCASMAAKTCHGEKASAMGGNVTETSANAGTSVKDKEGKKNKKAKKACNSEHKSGCCASKSAMGGNVSGTSASAGKSQDNAKSKKSCCKMMKAKTE